MSVPNDDPPSMRAGPSNWAEQPAADAVLPVMHTDLFDCTFCQVCKSGERADDILLCGFCDKGYHLACLDPPLEAVPAEDWFCRACPGRRNLHHVYYQQEDGHGVGTYVVQLVLDLDEADARPAGSVGVAAGGANGAPAVRRLQAARPVALHHWWHAQPL